MIINEFKTFIARGNVIDLAVGIIMGAAFTAIVNSLVSDVLMPPIGWALGGLDFSEYYANLSGVGYVSLAEAEAAGAAVIKYGVFINAVIKFVIVSVAVFFLVRLVNRIHLQARKDDPAAPTPPRQEVLLEEIRDLLKAKKTL